MQFFPMIFQHRFKSGVYLVLFLLSEFLRYISFYWCKVTKCVVNHHWWSFFLFIYISIYVFMFMFREFLLSLFYLWVMMSQNSFFGSAAVGLGLCFIAASAPNAMTAHFHSFHQQTLFRSHRIEIWDMQPNQNIDWDGFNVICINALQWSLMHCRRLRISRLKRIKACAASQLNCKSKQCVCSEASFPTMQSNARNWEEIFLGESFCSGKIFESWSVVVTVEFCRRSHRSFLVKPRSDLLP